MVWKSDSRITNCLGFALYREHTNGKQDVVETWVGFGTGPPVPPGTHKPSTEWPIQKFMWSDYLATPRETLRYRVVPMVGTEDRLEPEAALGSDWSDPVKVASTPGPISAYFNRGIVAAQWLSRQLGPAKGTRVRQKLGKIIATPNDKTRNFLSGALRAEMVALLAEANRARVTLYGALYELNDPELMRALAAFGKRAHVLLANGTHKTPKGNVDENAAARRTLRSRVNLSNRMVTGNHLAHNKFLVLCDGQRRPHKVWTGSTNWTETGLCTQANNGILIESRQLATFYKQEWDRLEAAGNGYPSSLASSNVHPGTASAGTARLTAWFAPTLRLVDLAFARRLIQGAGQGVLFLFFNPGPKGTLLNDILALDADRLYIHGVANQDPGGKNKPVIRLVHRGKVVKAPPEVALPAAIDKRLRYWLPEMAGYSMVRVHSKVVVVDPFGDHPVVMTGSHNLGPKASTSNDDNLVIVEHAPDLAAQYAVNIMTIYNQYRWRYFRTQRKDPTGWDGLENTDTWQDPYLRAGSDRQRELDFWLGRLRASP